MSSVIDDYEPLEIIGNGSFGVIRKVRRRSDGILFARKELNFERMTDRDRKQIVAEVNILKDLKHENIVRYINRYVDHENRILYILMEYCGGGDLGAIINNSRRQSRPLPEDQIWNYFVQILLALHHCHFPNARDQGSDLTAPPSETTQLSSSKQVLHRDLKPENVFLSTENEIKLGDFGLSKQITATTLASTYVGTPYYMSPELMSEKAYDTKSDIWSLGCMVYEMCALRAPFHDAQTYNELATAIRSGRIPPLPKGYSSALSSVIKSMLNINPAMRPSTQQLLKIEQLMYAKKLIDVNKMVPEIRSKHDAIVAREKAAALREQAASQREAAVNAVESELTVREAQLQTEREQMAIQKSQIAAELAQLVTQRAQIASDAAMLEKARAEMAQARAEFDVQVMQAKQAYEQFSVQRDAFTEERARWEQEVLSKMTSASLLDDVKNKPSLRSSRYANDDQTPTKATTDLYSKFRSNEDDDTTLKEPAARRHATAPPVPSLPIPPPAAVQRLQPQHSRKPAFLSDPPPRQHETPRRLTASKSMTDLGSAMKGVILTETGTVLPTPVRPDSSIRGTSLDLGGASADASGSSKSEASGERHRLPRRRSILQPLASRPAMPQSATTSMIPRVPALPGQQQQLNADASGASSSTIRPAPIWDHEDEENLPSPFVKKNIDFSVYSRADRGLVAPAGATGAAVAGKGLGATASNKPRTSMISKALKATGEAQKALARRQAESKAIVS